MYLNPPPIWDEAWRSSFLKVLGISNTWGCPVTLPLNYIAEKPLKNEITWFSVLFSSPKKTKEKKSFCEKSWYTFLPPSETSGTFSKAKGGTENTWALQPAASTKIVVITCCDILWQWWTEENTFVNSRAQASYMDLFYSFAGGKKKSFSPLWVGLLNFCKEKKDLKNPLTW